MMPTHNWEDKVEKAAQDFASEHAAVYVKSKRVLSASFEIGCFHALVNFYKKHCSIKINNLTAKDEYRYLTTPSGNPSNFSYVTLQSKATGTVFEIRQQVRIRSHIHDDIAFTPDLVVLKAEMPIASIKDSDYAHGKRSFYWVDSRDVIAAHECKSMTPFPELLISFLGMVIAAHVWLDNPAEKSELIVEKIHLAPTLFVGGAPKALHQRMVTALSICYPLNIVMGLHVGKWRLSTRKEKLIR